VILIGIGANLPAVGHDDARSTCEAALKALEAAGVAIIAVSPWYESEPVPRSDQPWYVNAVARVTTSRSPADFLSLLHEIESRFGRIRSVANAARTLDLDLLDFDGLTGADEAWPVLPHPRLHQRAFVLLPLRDIAPEWRHPKFGKTVDALVAELPPGQEIRPLQA
jgi:2-amino-4-hydroxy-6-hydroxymethyldihydropteridine diphosphokinase